MLKKYSNLLLALTIVSKLQAVDQRADIYKNIVRNLEFAQLELLNNYNKLSDLVKTLKVNQQLTPSDQDNLARLTNNISGTAITLSSVVRNSEQVNNPQLAKGANELIAQINSVASALTSLSSRTRQSILTEQDKNILQQVLIRLNQIQNTLTATITSFSKILKETQASEGWVIIG